MAFVYSAWRRCTPQLLLNRLLNTHNQSMATAVSIPEGTELFMKTNHSCCELFCPQIMMLLFLIHSQGPLKSGPLNQEEQVLLLLNLECHSCGIRMDFEYQLHYYRSHFHSVSSIGMRIFHEYRY